MAASPNAERHLLLTVARTVEILANITLSSSHSEAIKAALLEIDSEAKADVEESHGDEQS